MGQPTSPTTISPAAVIKATLESARANASGRRDGDALMAPPPAELLDDTADRYAYGAGPAEAQHPADAGPQGTVMLPQTRNPGSVAPPPVHGLQLAPQTLQPQGVPMPAPSRPLSVPPPPGSHPQALANASGNYPGVYGGQVPSASVSAPGVSVPAHFMAAQAPYSEARVDPPGTAVTSRTKVSGRPAMSWAAALMALGLFVGVGAVAVMQGNADSLAETSASFVDPARMPGATNAVGAQPVASPTPVPVPVTVTTAAQAAPAVAAPVTPAVAALVTAQPAAYAAPAVAAAPVTTAAPAAAAPAPAAQVAAAEPKEEEEAEPETKPAKKKPVVHHARRRPARTHKSSSNRPAKRHASTKSSSSDSSSSDVDEETRKALEALQRAQMENSEF